jgi:hypothetical protein
MADDLSGKYVFCEQCNSKYERIGGHWTRSTSCNYPSISEKKKDILIGLLMGDGSIGHAGCKNQRISTTMISPNYLKYVGNKLGWLSTGVRFSKSAKESATEALERGFDTNAKEENYADQYNLRTRSHPFITSLSDWYSSGSKVWPEDIKLTPTVLKHWYCGDGHYRSDTTHSNIVITIDNEIDNKEKISNYFNNVELPPPSNYNTSSKTANAEWTVEDSYDLWNYMGKPLPDFEYKWPKELRGKR